MALAKYYEDNMEIYIERMECMGNNATSNMCAYEPYRPVPCTTSKSFPLPCVIPQICHSSRTPKPRRRKHCDSLEYLSRQAYERGISYGQLIALRSSGMPLPPIIRTAR